MIATRPSNVAKLQAPPVVGQQYYVPCVESGGFWVPVMGTPHEDADLGEPRLHWHADLRFMTNEQIELHGTEDISRFFPPKDRWDRAGNFQLLVVIAVRRQLIEKRLLTCVREMPDYG